MGCLVFKPLGNILHPLCVIILHVQHVNKRTQKRWQQNIDDKVMTLVSKSVLCRRSCTDVPAVGHSSSQCGPQGPQAPKSSETP